MRPYVKLHFDNLSKTCLHRNGNANDDERFLMACLHGAIVAAIGRRDDRTV